VADFFNSIAEGVQNGDDRQVVELAKKALEKGLSARDTLEKGLVPGIRALG